MIMRQLAITDLSADAARAFRSMLEVLSGRTSVTWNLVETLVGADVIVTGEPARVNPVWSAQQGKRIVAIIEGGQKRASQHAPYVLQHPFRVMQVLAILEEIAEDYKRPELRIVRGAESGLWDFAESVRAAAGQGSPPAWYRTQTATGAEIIVTGTLTSCACESAVFANICNQTVSLAPLAQTVVQSVPARYTKRPLSELLWYNTWHASSALAPWLDPDALYGIRRWPDFGTIPPSRQQLQLVAMIARRPLSRIALARAVEASSSEIDRTLNALSLCGFIAPKPAPQVRAQDTSPLPGFIRSLLGSLRRRISPA